MNNNNGENFSELKSIIARLRSANGCPWDREQTHASLRPFLIEESYEVLEAIGSEEPSKLCEELGDLLLQIMLHAQISSEKGQFNVDDVIKGINRKLIHRHPHVFGDKTAKDAGEVRHNWEALKDAERSGEESLLSGVPRSMPALSFSHSIQRRAAGIGFDWEKTEDILYKVAEEAGEIIKAPDKEEKSKEFGDLLFALVNLARRLDIDLEDALSGTNKRFSRRFACMEKLSRERGVSFAKMTFDEKNALWDEAKKTVG